MNVYVESNFVLELVLLQEQHASCDEILRLAEERTVRLVVPAYSLVEPYETLGRRQRQRRQLRADLDKELGQLARSAANAPRLSGFQALTTLLIDSADEETERQENVRARLLRSAEVIPLTSAILRSATAAQEELALSPQDALVLASTLSHLRSAPAGRSCFLNRDSRDFDNPDLVAALAALGCTLVPRFDHGLGFVRSALA